MIRSKGLAVTVLASALVACASPIEAPRAAQREVPPGQAATVDFASIDSRAKAEALGKAGRLDRVFLFPLEGGGQDTELNVVYLPRKAAVEKAQVDKEILQMGRQGRISRYNAKPEYAGRSVVPSRIVVEGSGRESIRRVIEVW